MSSYKDMDFIIISLMLLRTQRAHVSMDSRYVYGPIAFIHEEPIA